MITILILSSGELKAISQNRVWDEIIASQCVLTSRRFCNFSFDDLKKRVEAATCLPLRFISAINSLRFSFQVNQLTETTQTPNPQFG